MSDVQRRASVSTKEGSDHGTGPALSHAHRRMSRMLDPALSMRMADRRMSTYRRPSIAGSQRTDLSHHSFTKPIAKQNTYRMEPKENEKFACGKVKAVMESAMRSFLEGESYDALKCNGMAQSLSEVIKGRIRDMNFNRFKIVCNVIIGQKADPSLQCASRCLWNTSTDTSTSATFENTTIFAVATVYGLYFE